MALFPSISCTIAVFSLYGEYAVLSFLSNGVFPPCDHYLAGGRALRDLTSSGSLKKNSFFKKREFILFLTKILFKVGSETELLFPLQG